MKAALKAAGKAALAWALSPAARRYEIPLAIGFYEAIRAGLGHS